MPQLTPFIAQKEGHYVYLVSPVNTEICVVDGNKQATLLQMKAGETAVCMGCHLGKSLAPICQSFKSFSKAVASQCQKLQRA